MHPPSSKQFSPFQMSTRFFKIENLSPHMVIYTKQKSKFTSNKNADLLATKRKYENSSKVHQRGVRESGTGKSAKSGWNLKKKGFFKIQMYASFVYQTTFLLKMGPSFSKIEQLGTSNPILALLLLQKMADLVANQQKYKNLWKFTLFPSYRGTIFQTQQLTSSPEKGLLKTGSGTSATLRQIAFIFLPLNRAGNWKYY